MTWLPKNNVLVPIDFSDASFHALKVAAQMVATPKTLTAVHVIEPLYVADPAIVFGTTSDADRLAASKEALAEKLANTELTMADGSTTRGDLVASEVQLGHAANSIADYAKQIGAELIVMPSHGRSGLERLLLGSVTERVLRMSECPVLVLRGE